MHYRSLITISILWFLADSLTKQWAESAGLAHKNTGIAFGIDLPLWLQIGISIVLIGALIKWFLLQPTSSKLPPPLLNSIVFGIILGGAFGNLISRIRFGYVIDFIKWGPIPIFNLADVGITVGITLLILSNLTERYRHPERSSVIPSPSGILGASSVEESAKNPKP